MRYSMENKYFSYINSFLYIVLLTLISAKLHSLQKYYFALELDFFPLKLKLHV